MNNSNDILLKVRNMKKSFHVNGNILKAIDDVSFDVKKGQIVGLIGESGSGKTTVGRCLIRLYEEYSGFVSLNNKVISGKKLSKKQRSFLNKNMQMIFQDPHASLNIQHNIYTILKEPLIVNKIMKKEYEDFFKDWDDIKQNFHYSFKEEVIKNEAETTRFHANEARKYLESWKSIINRIKFKYEDIENDFNQYYGYLLSGQHHESLVVSKMFERNSNIFDFYFKSRKEYHNDSILFVEQELKRAKHELNETIRLSKISPKKYIKLTKLAQLNEKYKKLVKQSNESKKNVKNMLLSYLKEFKNDYVSYANEKNITSNHIKYNELFKQYLIHKKIYVLMNKNINNLVYLEEEEIEKIILSLKKYKDELNILIDQKISYSSPEYKKQLKTFLDNNLNFNLENEIRKSTLSKNAIKDKISKLKKEIFNLKHSHDIDSEGAIKTKEDVLNAQKQYETLYKENEEDLKRYLVDYKKRVKKYEDEIFINLQTLEAIRAELKKLDVIFEQKHEEFINGLKGHLKNRNYSEKQIKNQVTVYENKVKLKKDSLNAFKVETKILNKDLYKLKHLLGIEKNIFSKKYIKKILINEKIYNALEEVGLLRQFAWRYPHEFSGGQRQRIVIARALISNPKIIIADEPIASLDVSIQAQVVNLLKDLCAKKNMALIFIAHDLSMVEYIADEILIMHLGKIVELGETNEIYENPLHPYTLNLFKSVPKISNANDKFESANFELHYLEEQKNDVYVDFFKVNDNHSLYCSVSQFKAWAKKMPLLSKYTKFPKKLDDLLETKNKSKDDNNKPLNTIKNSNQKTNPSTTSKTITINQINKNSSSQKDSKDLSSTKNTKETSAKKQTKKPVKNATKSTKTENRSSYTKIININTNSSKSKPTKKIK